MDKVQITGNPGEPMTQEFLDSLAAQLKAKDDTIESQRQDIENASATIDSLRASIAEKITTINELTDQLVAANGLNAVPVNQDRVANLKAARAEQNRNAEGLSTDGN